MNLPIPSNTASQSTLSIPAIGRALWFLPTSERDQLMAALQNYPVTELEIASTIKNEFTGVASYWPLYDKAFEHRKQVLESIASAQILVVDGFDRIINDRFLQKRFCAYTLSFPWSTGFIILLTNQPPKSRKYEVDYLNQKIEHSKYYSTALDLLADLREAFSLRSTRKRLENVGSLPISKITVEAISTALKDESCALPPELIGRIGQRVAEQVTQAILTQFNLPSNQVQVRDPVSNLVLPPQKRQTYAERQGDDLKKNAPQFLRDVWGDYLKESMLYTGHLKKVDPSLFNAILYIARRKAIRTVSDPDNPELLRQETAHYCRQDFNLITERDLAIDPPEADIARQVALIREANTKARSRPKHQLDLLQASIAQER